MRKRRTRDGETALDGRPVAATSPLHKVATFLDDVRLEAAAMRAPTPRPALAAIFDGRRTLPREYPPAVPRPRMTARLRPVTALVAATAVTFGGLATAGALPGPIQRASAQLGTHLGVRLPGTPPPAPERSTVPATPSTPPTTSSTIPSTTTIAPQSTTTTTTVPSGDRTPPTLPAPAGSSPTALPIPDLHGPIGPTGLRLPGDVLPRPTFRR